MIRRSLGRLLRSLAAAAAVLTLMAGRTGASTGGLQDAARDLEARVEGLLAQLTLDEKLALLGGADMFHTTGVPRLGLPSLKLSDGPSGARGDGPATTMGGVAVAASWNPEIARELGRQVGRDARARGVHFMLGPGVNIHRAPMNGRNFEYYGEDPLLAGRMAAPYIEGLQSNGVSATVKHLVANNAEFDRLNLDVVVDARSLREIYLPAFEAAVKLGHVGAVMTSYNRVNGVHMSQQGAIVNDIVKREWGFDGVVMSDWGATYDGLAAANGGQDLEMPGALFMSPRVLLPALRAGTLRQETIDDKVRRLLRIAVRFGWLGREQTDYDIPLLNEPGRVAALEAAREGIVLLKNDGAALPLDPATVRSIAVIGPLAHPGAPTGGGSGQAEPFTTVSLLEGLSAALGSEGRVTYHRGLPTLSQLAEQTMFTRDREGTRGGLAAELFDNAELTGEPALQRVDGHVNRKPVLTAADLGKAASAGGAVRRVSMRWTGYYTATGAGPHEVFLLGGPEGGGVRLFVDEAPVFDDWTLRHAFLNSSVLPLAAGPHAIRLEWFATSGFDLFGGALRLGIVPQDALVSPVVKTLAARADAVVVAAGWDADGETEGADRTFDLPIGQDQLIREVASVNPRTTVVLTSGGAVGVTRWLDRVPALVAAWYPGQEGGRALADVLLGRVNPSGRLPITWDRRWEDNPSHDTYYPAPGTARVSYDNGVFVGYRGDAQRPSPPLFPFGFGLSYTTFSYANLHVAERPGGTGPRVSVAFDLTNTGTRAGAEVAEVYVAPERPAVPRPVRELKGFDKVRLAVGERRRVTVDLDARTFAYWDASANRWRVDPGRYRILVGPSAASVRLQSVFTVTVPFSITP